MRCTRVKRRTAVVLDAVDAASPVGLRRPGCVIGHYQVQQAVVVVIEPGRADAQHPWRFPTDARLFGDIGEGSVAVVVIQGVPPGAANEDVLEAVIIVIAHGDAQIVADVFAKEPRFPGHVLERAVSFVAKQAVVERGADFLHLRQLRAVGEEDVHFAVVVVVEDGDAAGHRLHEVLPRRQIVIGDVGELRACGDIDEVRLRRLDGDCASGQGGRRAGREERGPHLPPLSGAGTPETFRFTVSVLCWIFSAVLFCSANSRAASSLRPRSW